MTDQYCHEYETCLKTHATLAVYHPDLDPDSVTSLLDVVPTSGHRRGDTRGPKSPPSRTGAWFLSTEGLLDSRDLSYHVDHLLTQLAGRDDGLKQLAADGCSLQMRCFWASKHGHGGPEFRPASMKRLSELGLLLTFDVYFYGDPFDEIIETDA